MTPNRHARAIRVADGYEVVLAVGGAIAAVIALIDPTAQSRVLVQAFEHSGAVTAYNAGCAAGGLAVVAGWALTLRWLRGRDTSPEAGLVVERLGLLIIGPLYVAYGTAIIVTSGAAALFAACITAGVGAAHLLRAWRVHRDLHTIRELVTADPIDRDPIDRDDGPDGTSTR